MLSQSGIREKRSALQTTILVYTTATLSCQLQSLLEITTVTLVSLVINRNGVIFRWACSHNSSIQLQFSMNVDHANIWLLHWYYSHCGENCTVCSALFLAHSSLRCSSLSSCTHPQVQNATAHCYLAAILAPKHAECLHRTIPTIRSSRKASC